VAKSNPREYRVALPDDEQTEDDGAVSSAPPASGHRFRDLASRLYQGDAGIDIVGKRKIWYTVAGIILLLGIVTFIARPFNVGIEFKGGNSFTIPASVGTLEEVRAAVADAGAEVGTAQQIGTAPNDSYLVKTELLDEDPAVAGQRAGEVRAALAERFGLPIDAISAEEVSGTWGASVSWQAFYGALIFLVLVVIYLSLVFREWKMAVAALVALSQNLILTATIYLLVGFEVTPSTVIGFLTILGFALYDVVVVFDKVRENTRGITGNPNMTFGEAANLAVNQTLMRSINTSVVALLPVGGLLFIGAGLLGAGTLKDLGLVLFIGMMAAVYSSIFFATPVLVDLKEAEPRFKQHKLRVLQRRAGGGAEKSGKALRPAAPAAARIGAGKAQPGKDQPSKAQPATASTRSAEPGDDETDLDLAGSGPRPGARPAPRKRPGSAGGRGRPGGSRGRKR
jgi:preprotein translocase subunit SecF